MIIININKAKTISHDLRRTARESEFAPLDIKITIPFESVSAESARQAIREKYALIQNEIDTASSVDELKIIIDKFNN